MAPTTMHPVPGSTAQRLEQGTGHQGPAEPTGEATQAIRSGGRAHPSDEAPGRSGSLKLPKAGEMLSGFVLRHELGRGAFARVFLAEQADLAGRPVALKVSAIAGCEPQTLAQLQHTSIVPIYSVHEEPARGLRAVCMPYFGGAPLSAVLQGMFTAAPRPLHGADLVRALAAASSPVVLPTRVAPPPSPYPLPPGERDSWQPSPLGGEGRVRGADTPPLTDEGPLATLSQLSYVRAAAWVVLQLAQAMHHAHQRGVLHRDIKPSNVLLCADGLPMLLDFNVAQDVASLQTQAMVVLGGTVAYMAPEQLRAVAERDLNLARTVDRRADVYSLGMVLFEMLTGRNPFDLSGSYSPVLSQLEVLARERGLTVLSPRAHRPDVPWGLESIVRKCLDPDPEQRYQYGEHLAEDLRRFLEDRPLKYAPELSWPERGRKWLRRHPRLTSSAAVAAVAALLLAGTGTALVAVRGRLTHTHEELQIQNAQANRRTFEEGTTKALCLVNTLVEVRDHLQEGVRVCEKTLRVFNILDRADWQSGSEWRLLSAADRQRLAEDARELLLLLAAARVRAAPGEPAVLRAALALLDRAERIEGLGPSRGLAEARADYLGQLGEATAAEGARAAAQAAEPASAREHYLLAAAIVRGARGKDDYRRAIAALTAALRLDDRHYWAWVQRGICHFEVGDLTAAAGDFGHCVGQWPDFAYGYYNRGYVLDRAGSKAAALADYGEALKRDAGFAPAYVSRGLLHLDAQRHDAALADLQKAHELGQDDAALHAGRGAALEGLRRHAEADAAFDAAFARLDQATPDVRTHVRLVHGFAVAKRLPDTARAAFAAVAAGDPRHGQALYGLALVDAEQGRLRDALASFDRALEANPAFTDARRFRAVLRARVGDLAGATQDINGCLEREPQSGAALYAAACVAARAWEQTLDPAAARQAVQFLKLAFTHHYGRDRAAADPDLHALREHPEFKKLLEERP